MDQPFRLLHAADLHLGRRFGSMPEGVAGRLVEARHQALTRLAEAARTSGARDILLAGDTFDSETPSPQTLRHALNAVAAASDLQWWVIPGNHDSLGAEALWDALARQKPGNLHVLTTPDPVAPAPGVMLLPAPVPRRRPGRDLTAWMDQAVTPTGALRLGLAHGAVQDFSETGSAAEAVIPPDRATRAGLDYLALGDWHGALRLGERTAYAGTPEAFGFRHAGRGGAWAVTLLPGAPPVLTRADTGQFHWAEVALVLVPGQDAAQALAQHLPDDRVGRRQHLMLLRATGRATLAAHQALAAAATTVAPDFAHFQLDAQGLATEIDPADLDEIDAGGALRAAADALAVRSNDRALPEPEQRAAAGALARLYSWLREGAA